jgi:mRNA interferase RelE/StbE
VNPYRVYITPEAFEEIKDLPGHIRQRVRKVISAFANHPNPPRSKHLEFPAPEHQLYRYRLDNWRIVYSITESGKVVDILAIRKRPPYDYGDLQRLLEDLG